MSGVATTNNSILTPNIGAQATGGLVGRTFGAMLADTYNIKDFGAIGDGNSHPLSGVVSSATVTAGGTGYTSAPTVTFSAPQVSGGVTAAGTAVIGFGIASTSISSGGSGYTSAPTVTFSAPQLTGGTTATATATITSGAISGITITDAGSGYTSAPSVTFSGGAGSGGAATAALATAGSVFEVQIATIGVGYTTAPSITFSGGSGSGAAATANLTSGVSSFGGQNTAGWTLAQWQVVYPLANALSQTLDELSFGAIQAVPGLTYFEVPAGNYVCSQGIEINCSARGTGKTTELTFRNTSGASVTIGSSAPVNFVFDGFSLVGNGGTSTGLLVNTTENGSTISNCAITGFYDGLYAPSSSSGSLITNIQVHNCLNNAFHIVSPNITITDCYAINNYGFGFYFTSVGMSGGLLIINSTSFNNNNGNFVFQGSAGNGLTDIMACNLVSSTCLNGNGILIDTYGEKNTFANIYTEQSGMDQNTGAYSGQYSNLLLTANNTNTTISNVMSWGSSGNGIQVNSGNPGFIMSGCQASRANLGSVGGQLPIFIESSENIVLSGCVGEGGTTCSYGIGFNATTVTNSVMIGCIGSGTIAPFYLVPIGSLAISGCPGVTSYNPDAAIIEGQLSVNGGILSSGSPVSAANTAGAAISTLTVGASPYAYTASVRGEVIISGGTVTAVTLTRSGTTVTMPMLSGAYSMMAGDVLTVTYTAAPTMTFVPL